MKFFFDRSVSPYLARMIGCFDRKNQAIEHDQHFEPDTPDVEWISAIRGWDPPPVVISFDLRILRNRAEAQVLRDAGLTFFAAEAAWAKLPWDEMAWKFVKVWPHIRENAAPRRPSVFLVPISATKVDLRCLTSEL